MSRIIVFYLLVLCTPYTWGQGEFNFRNYTTDNGLSNNTVLDMTQDKYGRIWLATYDGISIFDGSDFKVIRSIPEKNDIPSGKAEQIMVDSSGNVWVLFENAQLVQIIDDNGKCKKYSQFSNTNGQSLEIDLNETGNIMAVYNGCLFSYNPHSESFVSIEKTTGFTSSEAKNIEAAKQKLQLQTPGVYISYTFYTPDHQHIWAASVNHGLFKVSNNQSTDIHNYSTQNTGIFGTNEFYCVFTDNHGNLWAGSKDHGVYMGTPKNTDFHYENTNNSIGTIRSLNKDYNGNLWVGTYNKGIYVKNNLHEKHLDLAKDKTNTKWNWVRCIHKDTEGNMWVGTYEGLCKISPKTLHKEFYSPGPESISKGRIYSIEESNGKMYIGEWGALTIYNARTKTFKHVDSFQHNIRKLFLSSKGELWVGTETSGIFVLDTNTLAIKNRFSTIGTSPSNLNSNSIFEINEDSKGNIWIGTFGGLHCLDAFGNIKNISWVNEAMPSTLIYKILIDAKDQLWCSTPQGLIKISPNNSLIRVYDKVDGLNIHEFSEGAAFTDPENKMYFGGVNGICALYPNLVTKTQQTPKVRLSSIIVDGENEELPIALENGSDYSFSYHQNNIRFNLKSILINTPDKCSLAWKLAPVDKTFSYSFNSQHVATYRHLKPGRYKLIVKAANADDIWTEPKSIFEFSIEKPFWEEFYFLAPLSLFILFGTYLIIRIRFSKIKNKNRLLEETIKKRTAKIEKQKRELEKANQVLEEKNAKVSAQRDQILAQRDHLLELHQKLEESDRLKSKFFTNISHDIRTPLTLIHAPLKELVRSELTHQEHIPIINRMITNSEYILKLLGQVLDKKKLDMGGAVLTLTQGDIVQSCQTIVDSFSDQLKQSHLKLSFETNPDSYLLRYDHDKLQQILFNLLTNAVKFSSKNGEIRCSLSIDTESLNLEVSDNGIGIPPNRIKYIFDRYYQVDKASHNPTLGSGIGLSMVKEFTHLFNGQINVESKEGVGSTFKVSLPLQLPHRVDYVSTNNEIATQNLTSEETISKSILLVEDNYELRDYLKNLFQAHYNVVDVQNGLEALDYLKKHPNIDLILSDWIMPKMDGIELCRTIKRKTRFQSVPFIMLSALTDIDNQIEGYLAGIDEYLAKPFDPELILLKVSNILNRENKLKKAAKLEEKTQPQNTPIKTHNDKLLERIMALLEQELSNADFGQAELADKLGMNPTKLYRKVKELTQMTPNDFMRSVRIKRAEQLLKNKNLIINEISYMVGFNDPKYFSRCFSKTFGKSPSKYRLDIMDV